MIRGGWLWTRKQNAYRRMVKLYAAKVQADRFAHMHASCCCAPWSMKQESSFTRSWAVPMTQNLLPGQVSIDSLGQQIDLFRLTHAGFRTVSGEFISTEEACTCDYCNYELSNSSAFMFFLPTQFNHHSRTANLLVARKQKRCVTRLILLFVVLLHDPHSCLRPALARPC